MTDCVNQSWFVVLFSRYLEAGRHSFVAGSSLAVDGIWQGFSTRGQRDVVNTLTKY